MMYERRDIKNCCSCVSKQQTLLVVLIACFCLAIAAFAQSPTGAVNGTVTDPTGGIVPGASITLRNVDTGIAGSTRTNASGYYSFPAVAPGVYVVEAEHTGFKSTKVEAFTLTVNQTLAANIVLAVGAVSERVMVTAEAPLLSSTAELGTVIEQKAITELPLNGRNFTQLLLLTPGVSPVNVAQDFGGTVTLPGSTWVKPSVNGQSNRSNLYLMDGIVNTENHTSGYAVLPSLDAIKEFKVQSHNDQGDVGLVTGGVVNLVTNTGTNAIHGSGFEFVRNDFFNARNPFTDVAPGRGPAVFRQNQFGATLGGPVILPKLYDGRNKTFFFFSYDAWRYRLAQSSRYRVPTDAELGGDFSRSGPALYDPSTARVSPDNPRVLIRDLFPGNIIPANRLNKTMIATLQALSDKPNLALDGTDNVLNNRPGYNNSNGYQIRLDHQAGAKTNLFARYNDFRNLSLSPTTLLNGSITDKTRQQVVVGWNQVLSPSLLLTTRAAFTTGPWGKRPEHDLTLDEWQKLGWPTAPRFGDVRLRIDNLGTIGIGGDPNSRTIEDQIQFSQDLNWQRGVHQFKAGWLMLRQMWGGSNPVQSVSYAADQTADSSQSTRVVTGLGLASAVLGLPSNYEGLDERFGHRWYTFSFYFQDQWKVTRTLTLNLTLRYEFENPTKYSYPLPGDFDYTTGFFLIGGDKLPAPCAQINAAPCIPGNGLSSVPGGDHIRLADRPNIRVPDHNNFGPRLGIAWNFAPRTVLRAGAGIMYDVFSGVNQQADNVQGRWPGNGDFSRDLNQLGNPLTLIDSVLAQGTSPLPDSSPWPSASVNFDPHKRSPYSFQFHGEVQHQFSGSMVASIAYVASLNRRLDFSSPINVTAVPGPGTAAEVQARRPYPYVTFSLDGYGTDRGRSDYNSMVVTANRRFSKGLLLMTAYTWSKSIDNGSGGWFGEGKSIPQDVNNLRANRAISAFDVTHNFFVAANWELPFGRGRRWIRSGAGDWLLGGWRMNVIQGAHSGQVWYPQVARDLANVGRTDTYIHPNLTGNPYLDHPTAQLAINKAAFGIPQFAFGNLGRNVFRSDPVTSTDFSLSKVFSLRERMKVELRGEAFNPFNVMIEGVPNATVSNSNFGTITKLAAGMYPRQLQIGTRITF